MPRSLGGAHSSSRPRNPNQARLEVSTHGRVFLLRRPASLAGSSDLLRPLACDSCFSWFGCQLPMFEVPLRADWLACSFGVFAGDKLQEMRIWFDAFASRLVRERITSSRPTLPPHQAPALCEPPPPTALRPAHGPPHRK